MTAKKSAAQINVAAGEMSISGDYASIECTINGERFYAEGARVEVMKQWSEFLDRVLAEFRVGGK